MLRHYLKIASRNLWKNKVFTLINITGLTVGLACCIMIGLFIADELSFDRFHANKDNIVRATMEYNYSGGEVKTAAVTGNRAGPRLKATFPWVKEYVRTMKSEQNIAYGEKQFTEKNVLYADSSFFSVFTFPIITGDAQTALNGNDRVVITESAARKYFGDENPVGKIIRVGNLKDYTVSAVAKDAPSNSQIQFDFVINFMALSASQTEQWWTANYITWFLLRDNTHIPDIEKQVGAYMATPQVKQEAGLEGNRFLRYHFEPITSIHLHSALDGFEPNGNISYIYILAVIALLILVIACVNYTNLAIAQSANRSGEIGIRKVLGALRKQLFVQFIGESAMVTFFSLIIAVLICTQLIGTMNTITGKHILLGSLLHPKTLLILAATGIVLSLLAGMYPALVLSGSVITSILKKGTGLLPSGSGLRKSLIIVQFIISVFLISTTVIIQEQMRYIRNKQLGFDKEHVLVMPINYQQRASYDALKEALKLVPGVSNVSGAYDLPTSIKWSDGITADNASGAKELPVKAIPVDQDFIGTMNMQLAAGSDFSRSDLALMDTSDNRKNFHYTYMLNETAARSLGWTPAEAVGKIIHGNSDGTVKAVVKDFHFASMHEEIGPLVIFMDKSYVRNMLVRFHTSDVSGLVSRVESLWKERMAGSPFNYHFMDDDFNNMYKTEQRTAAIFSVSASLAIFLACLGLFGLAAFTTMQRTKEIGIRKVLGAGVLDIVSLISKDFLVLIGYALLIATPLAWLASAKWLQDFAYRVHPGAAIFILAGAGVTLLALATVSIHAIRTAMINPVKSLRSE
jgi:putative ABC transport system permease protein